jgi:hypothetical protein
VVSAEQVVRFETTDGQVIASFVTTNGVHPPVPWVGEVVALPASGSLERSRQRFAPYYSAYDDYRVLDVKLVYNRVIDAAGGDDGIAARSRRRDRRGRSRCVAIHVEYISRVLVEPVKYGSEAPDASQEGR